jgi:hypothetical protein
MVMKQNEELSLTAQQQEYLDWLCLAPSERFPATKTLFAESIGLGRKTLHRWEKKDSFVSMSGRNLWMRFRVLLSALNVFWIRCIIRLLTETSMSGTIVFAGNEPYGSSFGND